MVSINTVRVFLLSCCVSMFFFPTAQTRSQENQDVSAGDLQEVVSTLEDPQKREALLKDLKGFIRARATTRAETAAKQAKAPEEEEPEALFIEVLFAGFDDLTGSLIGGGRYTLLWLSGFPEVLAKGVSLLKEAEIRNKALRLLSNVALAMLAAWVIRIFIRKRVPVAGQGALARAVAQVGRVILAVIPYGGILFSLFILFKTFPSFGWAQSLFLHLFTVLFFYRLAVEVFSLLLSPDDAGIRIIPLGDENANYLWVWVLRFARYTAFAIIIIQFLLATRAAPSVFSFLRGVLYLVFPCMITVFILQVARELRLRLDGSEDDKSDENPSPPRRQRLLRSSVGYGAVLIIAYGWAVFLFLVFHYRKGFHFLFEATLWTCVSALALLVAMKMLEGVFQKFFTINEKVRSRLPGLEERTNRYILVLRRLFRWALAVVAFGVIAQIWGIPVSRFVTSEMGSTMVFRVIAILITAGMVMAVMEVTDFLSHYYLKEKTKGKEAEAAQKMKTLVPVIKSAIKITAAFVGGIVVLDRLGVNTGPILAGAGILGLAVGFGSQALVKDLINGLFILFEETIRVGDWAIVGGKSGMVESIGLRKVRLRGLEGSVHVIPNSAIDTLTNMTKEFSRYVLDVGVAYRENVDEVIKILKEIGDELYRDPEWGKDMIEPLEVFGLDRFDDSAVVIRARLITKPLRQWALGREFNRRMKKVFDERGIEIPFPHRTVYMGEPKAGASAPLNVTMSEPRP
ncbi:MAG: mechanosensitive ion channel [Deltaproteobacteria bacterium]|nr:mechanosensitive ion channel [Deltaproteobacteria bacterium]